MLISMLIIYLIVAVVGIVVLILIIDRVVERYSLLPSSVSLLWIVIFLVIGINTNIAFVILPILYQIFMFFKYYKLEEIVTSKLIIRLDQQGFSSIGNLAKCLKIDNNIEVLGRIIANMKVRNKIPSDIEFDSSGGYISKLQDGTEWNETFCQND